MDTSTPIINSILFGVSGFVFGVLCLFFAYCTARLVHFNLTVQCAAAYRTRGMLIAGLAFPLATIVLGFISWLFINKAVRGFEEK